MQNFRDYHKFLLAYEISNKDLQLSIRLFIVTLFSPFFPVLIVGYLFVVNTHVLLVVSVFFFDNQKKFKKHK